VANSNFEAIGGAWEKTTRIGKAYLSGNITLPDGTSINITIFDNKFKADNPTRPDRVIYARVEDLELMRTLAEERGDITQEDHPF